MTCVLVPSVTLYGTTQVPSVRTITHTTTTTYLGEAAISLQTLTSTVCDSLGADCRPGVATSLVTITPTVTTTIYSTETRAGLVTNVVPQQTLYYPCSASGTRESKETATADASTIGETSDMDPGATAQVTGAIGTATTSSPSDAIFSDHGHLTSAGASGLLSMSSTSATSALVNTADTAVSAAFNDSNEPSASASQAASPGTMPSPATFSNPSAPSSSPSPLSSRSPTGPVIAGAVVGAVVGSIVLCFLIAYCRRNRRFRPRSASMSIGKLDYWERRFRDLEADKSTHAEKAPGQASSLSPTSLDASSPAGMVKRLRLTLDLHSRGISTRPASRLSAISAFFSSKPMTAADATDVTPAEPLPFAGRGKSGFNFSRPRFGKRHSTISGVSRVSGVAGKSKTSKRDPKVPRSTRQSLKPTSNGLDCDNAPVTPSVSAAHESSGPKWTRTANAENRDVRDRILPTERNGAGPSIVLELRSTAASSPGARGWSAAPSTPSLVTSPVPSASRFSDYDTATPVASYDLGRRLTLPKRSTLGSTPTPAETAQDSPASASSATDSKNVRAKPSQASLAFTTSTSSLYSSPSTEVSFFAPPLVVSTPRSLPSATAKVTQTADPDHAGTVAPPQPSPSSSILAAPRSFAAHRQPSPSRKGAPELLLSPDAITPSLWVDEEVYDLFRLVQPAHLARHRPQSRFSPNSSISTFSTLPTTGPGDPYGETPKAAASATPLRPHDSDVYDRSLNAYHLRTDSACSSVPPSAAISLTGSTSTFDDDTGSASFGRAWRASTTRTFERSAVTPQLPIVQFGDLPIFAESMGLSDADQGPEERMQTLYHVE